jgi:hypothetical protein
VKSKAQGWIARLRAGPLWLILWSIPLWAAVGPRLLRHKTPWLVDFKSVVCAAGSWDSHRAIYSASASCGGVHDSQFVYPPWVAAVVGYPVGWLGEGAVLAAYAGLFLAVLLLLFWLVFWRPMNGIDRPARTPFLGFTSGNLVFVGNIAVVMQAGIVAAALFLGAESIACTAAIVLAGLVKPIYLTFLAVPAFSSASWRRRIGLVVVGAGVVAGLCLSHLPLVPEWRAFVLQVAVDPHPGGGLLGWLGQLGVTAHPVLGVVYLVYAALLFGAGLAIVETGRLNAAQRVWLALTIGVLLLPRIMAYDLLLIGPGLLVASQAASRVSRRVGERASALWLAACGIYLVSSLLGGVFQIGHSIALVLVAGGVVWLGGFMLANMRRSAPDLAAPDVNAPAS